MNDATARSTQGSGGTWSKSRYLQASTNVGNLPNARWTLLGPTSTLFYHKNTALTMSTRSDNHIIEPVPGVVLYKVTKSREQPKRLGPAFVHFTN